MRGQSRKLNGQHRRQIWTGCKIYRSTFFDFQDKIITCDPQAQYEQDIRIAEMQAEMVEFDNKIFELVCEKDELETRLKFAEISAILLYEEFQVVNQDQVQALYMMNTNLILDF